MLDEHSPVFFSSAFAPSGLQTVTAFEVVWKKGEREGGMEGGEKSQPWVYLALRQMRQLPPRFLNK